MEVRSTQNAKRALRGWQPVNFGTPQWIGFKFYRSRLTGLKFPPSCNMVPTVGRISLAEADALVGKLSSERIPVHTYFKSSSGSEARMLGFVEYRTPHGEFFLVSGDPTARNLARDGLMVTTSGPSLVPGEANLSLRSFHSRCEIWYGDKRELPEEQKHLAEEFVECALSLCFMFPDFNECLALFFSI